MAAHANSINLEQLIAAATGSRTDQIPGLVFQCVNRKGESLFSTASGVRGIDDAQPMTIDTSFWIASCTKMVTSIALMQLVEQGKAWLDDSDQLEEILPELRKVKILEHTMENGERKLHEKEKKNRITLRMLQTHTAGFGYSFFSTNLWRQLGENADLDEFQNRFEAIQQPVHFEPGTNWAYSIGIDWVGKFIERVSGLSLGQYFEKNIFAPLEIKNTSFVPTQQARGKLARMHQRDDAGIVHPRPHLLKAAREELLDDCFHSGGAGLISNANDYCRILATMLNDGISPTTKLRILEKSTIDQMFTNQIPDWNERYAKAGYDVSRPDLATVALENGLPVYGNQGWGLNFLLEGDSLQRASAPGLSNCFWGMDREKGVGAIVLSQVLPFGDPVVAPLWSELQKLIYQDA